VNWFKTLWAAKKGVVILGVAWVKCSRNVAGCGTCGAGHHSVSLRLKLSGGVAGVQTGVAESGDFLKSPPARARAVSWARGSRGARPAAGPGTEDTGTSKSSFKFKQTFERRLPGFEARTVTAASMIHTRATSAVPL